MDGTVELSRPVRRLLSEMADDGVTLDADGELLAVVLEELEYARRPHQFERRTPVYGSMIVPADRSLITAGELVDLIPLDDRSLDEVRRFADGRAAFLALQPGGAAPALATFRRSVQYEADMVEVQADTGAFIVQRTPVLGVTRLFTATATIEWSGYRWSARPNARALHELLKPWLSGIAPPVLRGLLELAVHWLSPARVGATLVVPVSHRESGLDLDHSIEVPGLWVTSRNHYPSLLSALMQTDLATVVDGEGTAHHIGVGLHWSAEAEAAVETSRGMRHRSAARYTWDNPDAVAVVVSEDGPITVFHHGKAVSECAASLALAATNGDAA
jgi:DisA bacterial checkpoint controller nucleotide-binding